jgi:hypothetical protein
VGQNDWNFGFGKFICDLNLENGIRLGKVPRMEILTRGAPAPPKITRFTFSKSCLIFMSCVMSYLRRD